jgi:excisionase family DNA binding protein
VKKRQRPLFDERVTLSVAEVAVRNGMSESFVYEQIKAGRLRATKPGGVGPLRVRIEDEAAWIEGEEAA